MMSHINKLVQSCFYSLRQIQLIRRSLTFDAARKIICSLIHSRVDYCKSLFAGLLAQSIDHLQSILNASARLACGLHKYDHITPALRDRLHWLTMQQRITYQLTPNGLKARLHLISSSNCIIACQHHRVTSQASLCCWRTAYRSTDFYRFWKKNACLCWSVSMQQLAY